MRHHGTLGIRSHLVLLLLGALLPVLVFSGFVVASFWQQQRDTHAQASLGTVRALAVAVEAEIEASVRSLRSLGLDADFDGPPQGGFAAIARRELNAEPSWDHVMLVRSSGATVASVGRTVFQPAGTFVDPVLLAEVASTGKPGVSGFHRIEATRAGMVQIAVPVVRGTAVSYVLVATLEAGVWAKFLSNYEVPANSTITLVDGKGIIIARTLNNERWAGSPPSPGLLAEMRRSPTQGAEVNVGLEGVRFQSAHRRLRNYGWTIASGIPLGDIEATLLAPTLAIVLMGVVATLAALATAFLLGRRIAAPVGTLAQAAKLLSQGEMQSEPRSVWIEEVERAHEAFAGAARLLRTRQDEVQESLAREREARAQAEAASHAKDEFLAMLGHELRNPLNAIAASNAVLERVDPTSEHATRSRAVVARQTAHLTDLVNDLLDVARVTTGKVVLSRRLLDLGHVVTQGLAVLREAGRFARHQVELDAGSAWISGDETRIEQIAVNLVENAVKYTAPGRLIHVRVAEEGSEAVLEVSDEGEGIAPELLKRVFELFIQGERTLDRAQGGLGLGLTLVKTLAELHGGRVSAHSEGVGKGSRFVVRLPRVLAPERVAEAAPAIRSEGRSRRVLLVEDNADSAETLRTLLSLRGHEVHVASDGPSGVELARSANPEVALVDIGLPGYDGFEVARRLRAAPGGDAMRLVALTGYGQPEDHRAASAAGFDELLVKPVDLEALSRIFERA